jgi:hypothetical protein
VTLHVFWGCYNFLCIAVSRLPDFEATLIVVGVADFEVSIHLTNLVHLSVNTHG